MEKGDIVTIYEDPYTKKIVEGRAKLIKCHRKIPSHNEERWDVEFLDEPDYTYYRRIIL